MLDDFLDTVRLDEPSAIAPSNPLPRLRAIRAGTDVMDEEAVSRTFESFCFLPVEHDFPSRLGRSRRTFPVENFVELWSSILSEFDPQLSLLVDHLLGYLT